MAGYLHWIGSVCLVTLDLSFAIQPFTEAWNWRVENQGFPVWHGDDIIASKTTTLRKKDFDSQGEWVRELRDKR